MDNLKPETTKENRKKQKDSRGGAVNALVILICIDLILFFASIYILKAEPDPHIFLIPAALTLVVSVITAMVAVQVKRRDSSEKERLAGDVAEALKAIIEITSSNEKKMDDKLDELSDEYQIPAQEIINAVKALAKVSLGRSKENATALINSNEAVVTQVMDLQDKIDALEKKVAEVDEKQFATDTGDNFHKVIRSIDDMNQDLERMDQDIRRLEKATRDIEMRPPVMMQTPVIQQAQAPVQSAVTADQQSKESEEENSEVLNNDTTEPLKSENQQNQDYDESEDISEEPEIGLDDINIDDDQESEETTEPEKETETEAEDLTTEQEIPAEEIAPADDDLTIDEPSEEIVADEEPVSGDPNKQLSPDEIAALFAQASAPANTESTEPSPAEDITKEEPEKQSQPEPAAEEVEQEPQPTSEPTPTPVPAPTVSEDPNKKLSPDEIAALFAQASAPSEPEQTDETSNDSAQVDDSATTASETEATTSSSTDNTGSTETEAATDTGSKPDIQVTGDPNRMMTPEEIEALFSNVS